MTSENILKIHAPFLNGCSQEVRNIFLKIGLGVMQSSQDRSKVVEKVSQELNIEKSKLVEIIASYIEIIKLFLKTNNKEFNVILEQFGFSSVFINELPLVPNREEVECTIKKSYKTETRILFSLKWRIDLSLYDEFVNKNAKSVIIQLNMKDGKRTTLKIDIKTFHKLRYNISLILKEMARLKDVVS